MIHTCACMYIYTYGLHMHIEPAGDETCTLSSEHTNILECDPCSKYLPHYGTHRQSSRVNTDDVTHT